MRYPFVGDYRVTQKFNDPCCRASYAQFGMKGHNGIDYALPTGTPVVATENGTVRVLSDPKGFGNYIELVGSYRSIYAHLTRATVANGARVTAGQQIGLSGNTGNSTGPHLHFGVKPLNPNMNNGFFGAIDPAPLLHKDVVTKPQGGDMPISRDQVKDLYRVFLGREAGDNEAQGWVGDWARAFYGIKDSAEGQAYRAKQAAEKAVAEAQRGELTDAKAKLAEAQKALEIERAKATEDTKTLDQGAQAVQGIWGFIQSLLKRGK